MAGTVPRFQPYGSGSENGSQGRRLGRTREVHSAGWRWRISSGFGAALRSARGKKEGGRRKRRKEEEEEEEKEEEDEVLEDHPSRMSLMAAMASSRT